VLWLYLIRPDLLATHASLPSCLRRLPYLLGSFLIFFSFLLISFSPSCPYELDQEIATDTSHVENPQSSH